MARDILEAESKLRLSNRVQRLMAEAETNPLKDWISVVEGVVDPEICNQFNITAHQKHRILAFYPELNDDIFYGRYNRARRGEMKEGEVFVDVPLVDLTGSRTSLMATQQQQQRQRQQQQKPKQEQNTSPPLVIIAGSIT